MINLNILRVSFESLLIGLNNPMNPILKIIFRDPRVRGTGITITQVSNFPDVGIN